MTYSDAKKIAFDDLMAILISGKYEDESDFEGIKTSSGSVVGLEIGGDPISDENPLPIEIHNNIISVGHGSKTVNTAGTDVQLSASSVPCRKVTIQAYAENTGQIAIGGTGVDATAINGTGIVLSANDSFTIEVENINQIYIDSTVSGEGVRYIYTI